MQLDAEVERLAQRIVGAFRQLPDDRRLLVAVAGRPGSGKSTLAYPLADRVNELLLGHPSPYPAVRRTEDVADRHAAAGTGDEVAICVGQDGWHYSRAELDAFEDPAEAHWRRGAAFTFNLPSYASFIASLRQPLQPPPGPGPIPFPTFDHAAKDPAPSPVPVLPRHRIVIVEGLYTMLDKPGWRDVAAQMDLRVWFEVPRDVVLERVLRRNTAAGIVSGDGARRRVEEVDMDNGDTVARAQYCPTDVVWPVDNGCS